MKFSEENHAFQLPIPTRQLCPEVRLEPEADTCASCANEVGMQILGQPEELGFCSGAEMAWQATLRLFGPQARFHRYGGGGLSIDLYVRSRVFGIWPHNR